MFYSHTFLARKGPLGTVWCAAHLQPRLRKSHYISTNVPSTVDRIMSPEVPIALRMSGHLLLGVVRIYSKQVDYLLEDCNTIEITINRVFTTVNVNLPQGAAHAPLHSVTLLDLDAVNLDEYYKDLGEDSHLKSLDEITLSDQVSTGEDPYFIISFDQDMRGTSLTEDISETGATPMEEDVPPHAELNTLARPKDPSSSNHVDPINSHVGNITPQNLSSAEIRLDGHFNNSVTLPDRASPDRFMEEQINKDNEHFTLPMEEIVSSGGHFPSPHGREEHQPSPGRLNSPLPFDLPSPEMVIQQSPPNGEQLKVHKRSRRLIIDDEDIRLSNEHMKNLLNDTSDIIRERGNCPSSSLDVWRVNKRLRLRKEDVILDPYINGACATLEAIYTEDIPHQEMNVAQPPNDNDIKIEVLLNIEHASPERDIPAFAMKNNPPSLVGRSFQTPENSNLGLQSEQMETTGNTDGLLPTTGAGPSGYHDSGMETPDTFFDRSLQGEHTALSEIPEDLEFLDQDGNSTAGLDGTPEPSVFSKTRRGTPELQTLSSRTRFVAQYLKRQSSVTPISENAEDSSEGLSLNKIIEGKLRKMCARMFYETLVLTSHGLVDAHQETPYGDITLKVTSKLSEGQFAV